MFRIINYSCNSVRRQPNKKRRGRQFEEIFHKIRYWMANKHMKMWTLLVTGKCELKLQLDATTHPLKWLKLKQMTIPRDDETMEN